jgi:hypothetical protein
MMTTNAVASRRLSSHCRTGSPMSPSFAGPKAMIGATTTEEGVVKKGPTLPSLTRVDA